MTRQWNFIIENKLITVYGKDSRQAEEQAKELFSELQETEQ
ncbi:hypothetical protein [Bhargavaea beijingensis]|nr:hypothetical protein [Bhargavaea beijingensis]MCW1927409.1 hypothetical protein [Bhargavaea beijingensis]